MDRFVLCVQWPRFGPYHLARLERLAEWCDRLDIRLVGLETASDEELYDWRVEGKDSTFERVQVFPGRSFERISPLEMHRAVTARLDDIDADVLAINSYSLPDARACLAWSAGHGRGSILMSDTKSDDAERISWRESIKRRIVHTFDAALLAGTPHRRYIESLGMPADAIHLGYDVVDNEHFAEGARAVRLEPGRAGTLPGLDDETPFFLAVNRFIDVKNLDVLLRAYARFRADATEGWRLVLVGSGPKASALERTVANGEIPDVSFAGFRQIDELPFYYGRASCFIHPATKDTWALVVNEAMAAGLPVLVSTGAGCHEDLVIDGENGFIFDPWDERRLSELMHKVASDEKFRHGASAASRRIIGNWTLDTFASSMLDAAHDARSRAGRGLPVVVRLMIHALKWTRSHSAFHSAEV